MSQYQSPEEIINECVIALRQHLKGRREHALASDIYKLLQAVDSLKVRIPSPEGWVQTAHRPHPGPTKYHYVFHPEYGVMLSVYQSAEWEDEKLWVMDNHSDFHFLRPRYGWATTDKDNNWMLIDPQPTHYYPEPAPPEVFPPACPPFYQLF